jgi:hypothetical protein
MYASPSPHSNPEVMQHVQDCIDNCLACARLCEQCSAECLRAGSPEMFECIEKCRDCADICMLDARLMSRESPFHFQMCHICAKVCEACGTACDNMTAQGGNMDQNLLRECAAACHRCADSCREMAGMYKSDEMH